MTLSRGPAALAAGVMLVLGMPGASHAEPTDPVKHLCDRAPNGCQVTGPAEIREGTVLRVSVAGAPNVVSQAMVYRVDLDDQNNVKGLDPISVRGTFRLSASGFTSVDLAVPPMARGTAGWAFVSLVGQQGSDVSETVGQFIPLGSRRPMLLGDGFAEEKPVGRSLELHMVGAIPGSRFAVEYLNDHGTWQDVTDDTPGAVHVARQLQQVSHVRYQVPRGLRANTRYVFRLRNLSDAALSEPWSVIPTAHGVPQARRPQFVPPEVGTGLAGANTGQSHPGGLVQAGAWVLAGAAGLAVVAGVPKVRGNRASAHV